MGFRFRKSIRLLPGLRLNLSKGGISTSIGGPGASINFGNAGTRYTLGLPGTGLSFSQLARRRAQQISDAGGESQAGWIVGGLILMALIGLGLMASGPSTRPTPETTSAADEHPLAVVTASRLRCRRDPSTSAAVVGVFEQGDQVVLHDERDGWRRVGLNGTQCWVSSEFVRQTGLTALDRI